MDALPQKLSNADVAASAIRAIKRVAAGKNKDSWLPSGFGGVVNALVLNEIPLRRRFDWGRARDVAGRDAEIVGFGEVGVVRQGRLRRGEGDQEERKGQKHLHGWRQGPCDLSREVKRPIFAALERRRFTL